MNPFDLTGRPFLILYAVLFALAIGVALAIPRWSRAEGRDAAPRDPDELAVLAGGAMRLVDTVIARMLLRGQLTIEGKKKLNVAIPLTARDDIERSVAALTSPAALSAVQHAISRHAPAIERRLISAGLLVERSGMVQLRFIQTLPLILLFGFGMTKRVIGVMRDKPVGILTVFLVVTAIVALIRFAAIDRRTRGGVAALDRARRQGERLRQAPTESEMPEAVALWGTAILVGSSIGDYHQMRMTAGGDGSIAGDTGGDGGGGGCGGGGCGGCGG